MKEQLIQILNTMSLIETRGESTLIMADCVNLMSQLIQECDKQEEMEKKQDGPTVEQTDGI